MLDSRHPGSPPANARGQTISLIEFHLRRRRWREEYRWTGGWGGSGRRGEVESKHAAAVESRDRRPEESGLAERELPRLLAEAEASWAICMIRVETRRAAGN